MYPLNARTDQTLDIQGELTPLLLHLLYMYPLNARTDQALDIQGMGGQEELASECARAGGDLLATGGVLQGSFRLVNTHTHTMHPRNAN